jgi:hypothetical protein
MTPCTVYALLDPTTHAVRYVGKTISPRHRLFGHLSEATSGHACDRCDWIRSLTAASLRPTFRSLVVVSETDGPEMERRVIALYRTQGRPLINLGAGGDGPLSETRAKMSATRTAMGAVVRTRRAAEKAQYHATHTQMPAAVLEYFRSEGKRGATMQAAAMTPAQRKARAIKASQAAALARTKKKHAKKATG